MYSLKNLERFQSNTGYIFTFSLFNVEPPSPVLMLVVLIVVYYFDDKKLLLSVDLVLYFLLAESNV
jgi:hypothetical protein